MQPVHRNKEDINHTGYESISYGNPAISILAFIVQQNKNLLHEKQQQQPTNHFISQLKKDNKNRMNQSR